jgi:DNA processing protein
MNDRNLTDLVISLIPDLRSNEKITVLKNIEDENDLLVTTKSDIENIIKRNIKSSWDMASLFKKAEKISSVCTARSINWLSWKEAGYPPLLREIYDPPAVLFYRGILPDPQKPLLGMVGTRKPSIEGAAQGYTIARGLGREGISVVSGLALGIDSMCHRGNLDGGAPGYAVLGSGADEIYPKSNRTLVKRILDTGGALLSEYAPGTIPYKSNFPARNRIIAGLSRAVLIVEAPARSGALITANYTLDQGKDLFVASSGVRTDSCRIDKSGTVKLGIEGAEIIYNAGNILDKWNKKYSYDNELSTENAASAKELALSLAKYLDIEVEG